MADMRTRIYNKLQEALNPSQLQVENQSHLHSGHAGDDGSGETHFHVVVASCAFDGQARLAKERMIYKALSDEVPLIHALSIDILKE